MAGSAAAGTTRVKPAEGRDRFGPTRRQAHVMRSCVHGGGIGDPRSGSKLGRHWQLIHRCWCRSSRVLGHWPRGSRRHPRARGIPPRHSTLIAPRWARPLPCRPYSPAPVDRSENPVGVGPGEFKSSAHPGHFPGGHGSAGGGHFSACRKSFSRKWLLAQPAGRLGCWATQEPSCQLRSGNRAADAADHAVFRSVATS